MNTNGIICIAGAVIAGSCIGKNLGEFSGKVEGKFAYIELQKKRIERVKNGEIRKVLEELVVEVEPGADPSVIHELALISALKDSILDRKDELGKLREKHYFLWKLLGYEKKYIKI